MVMEQAEQRDVFSVQFDFTTKRGFKASLYRKQPKPLWRSNPVQQEHRDDEKENVSSTPASAPAPAGANGARQPEETPAPPPPPLQRTGTKQPNTTAGSQRKPQRVAKIDKNALSARSSDPSHPTHTPKVAKPPHKSPSSPRHSPGSSPASATLFRSPRSDGTGASELDDMDDSLGNSPQSEAGFPPLPDPKPKPTPVVVPQPPTRECGQGAGADFTGSIPPGLPPPGLPAHVYLGKGYGFKPGFNSATYGGTDPWLSGGRGRGRGGGP